MMVVVLSKLVKPSAGETTFGSRKKQLLMSFVGLHVLISSFFKPQITNLFFFLYCRILPSRDICHYRRKNSRKETFSPSVSLPSSSLLQASKTSSTPPSGIFG